MLAGCSLNRSKGKNWVENEGGLPEYICQIARSIHKDGKPISMAIAIAVSQVKKWAAGGKDVDADTRAKAAKAVAEWEAMKAKAKAKKVKKIAASNVLPMDVIARGFRIANSDLYDVSVEDTTPVLREIHEDAMLLSMHYGDQEWIVRLSFVIDEGAVRFTEALPVAVGPIPSVVNLTMDEDPGMVALSVDSENLSWGGCI